MSCGVSLPTEAATQLSALQSLPSTYLELGLLKEARARDHHQEEEEDGKVIMMTVVVVMVMLLETIRTRSYLYL